MTNPDLLPRDHPRRIVVQGWLVHSLTASGAICGMFGLIAVADGQPRAAVLWLVVAMILDGIDGPAARAWDVSEHVPRIDGSALDLIVDFVTCIVIPVLFLHQFGMLPDGLSLVVGAFILFTSALWMSRTDQMSDDHYFNGFPGEWNMIVPTLYLLGVEPWPTAVLCIILALTQFTNIKFVHPVQVRRRRTLTISVTVTWLGAIVWATAARPGDLAAIQVLLVACPLYILGTGLWRTFEAQVEVDPEAAPRLSRA